MRIACFLVGAFFFLTALISARNTWRTRAWPRVKANVVHWIEAAPIGKPVPPRRFHQYLVIRRDGSEEVVSYSRPDRSVIYYAELVYYVDGRVYAADLAFDEPVNDTFDVLINPDNPKSYDFPAPDYWTSLILCGLGALFFVAAAS
jgi:hypothetical protein